MSDSYRVDSPHPVGRAHVAHLAPTTVGAGVLGRGYDLGQLTAEPRTERSRPSSFGGSYAEALAESARAVLLSAHQVSKSYRKGLLRIPVLQGVDLSIGEGEFLAIVGASGCGKSTLLHLLATLDAPDAGQIQFEGHRIDNLPGAGRDILRNRYFGMIFQSYHLLPELTTFENVLAPAMIGAGLFGYWRRRREHHERAAEMLELVGLSHRLKHMPRELSGGEMQRAAIARALVSRPRVLLADEPTGNLDKKTGGDVLALLSRLNREQNLTIVMVTHDGAIAAAADRSVTLVDGRVQAA
jgi:lipoprotein-releasing system ATP-binding protein